MKILRVLLIAFAIRPALPAQAITSFTHVVVIVQENRTPDNLFNQLCEPPASAQCNSVPSNSQYDILTDHWLSKNAQGQQITITPAPVDLGIDWDIRHHHNQDWVPMCDAPTAGQPCQMDGAAGEVCHSKTDPQGCNTNGGNPEFTYVERYNTNGQDVLGPYITLALNYGWANLMFQSNQGPSFPAHQFIYGATSAPLVNMYENDDADGTYAAENAQGCLDPNVGAQVATIIHGVENGTSTYPCFTHQTLGTLPLFGTPKLWRYYAPPETAGFNLWNAPQAMLPECGVSNQGIQNANNLYTACTGSEFKGCNNANVVTDPRRVLADIQSCNLQELSWVIPNGTYSDHAGVTGDYGPQWVASIVNAIGGSGCKDGTNTYWQDTAIIITWDDWGGWYDHEKPTQNTTLGYQLGFRVPLLVVSAYGANNTGSSPRTCMPFIDGSDVLDFGSIANFIEGNFSGGWTQSNEGLLGFADARARQRSGTQDLTNFFDLTKSACTFVPIPNIVGYDANFFMTDPSPMAPPDDDE